MEVGGRIKFLNGFHLSGDIYISLNWRRLEDGVVGGGGQGWRRQWRFSPLGLGSGLLENLIFSTRLSSLTILLAVWVLSRSLPDAMS